jgi:hypothetical protein
MSDSRIKREPEDIRQSRAMDDRAVTENRVLTDDDRLNAFRQSFVQAALPDLPKIPGFHVCWLTTTNPRDSIANRIRIGYTPVTSEDVPGFEYATLKTGEYAGLIGVNEMLAFKLPVSLYQKYMEEWHHDAPTREEIGVSDMSRFREEARSRGLRNAQAPLLEDGSAELRQPVKRPKFEA